MTLALEAAIQDLAHRAGGDRDLPFALPLRFGDYDLKIASNSEPLIDMLRHIYRFFLDDAPNSPFAMTIIDAAAPEISFPRPARLPGPSGDDADEEVYDLPDARIVQKTSKGLLFAIGNRTSLAVLPCARHGNKVVNFINSRYIEWQLQQGGVLAHASSVRSARRGVMLAGAASAGKTTLAFRLLDDGLRLIGRDNLIVRREAGGLRMYGTPAPPRVNPGTALNNPRLKPVLDAAYSRKLEKLSREELWDVDKKHDVCIEEVYGPDSTGLEGPADAMVILNWRHGGGPTCASRVDLNERPDLLELLVKRRGRFYRAAPGSDDPEPAADAYLAVLGGCPVHEVCGGIDFEYAARLCAGLV